MSLGTALVTSLNNKPPPHVAQLLLWKQNRRLENDVVEMCFHLKERGTHCRCQSVRFELCRPSSLASWRNLSDFTSSSSVWVWSGVWKHVCTSYSATNSMKMEKKATWVQIKLLSRPQRRHDTEEKSSVWALMSFVLFMFATCDLFMTSPLSFLSNCVVCRQSVWIWTDLRPLQVDSWEPHRTQ